jgi:hypothetical protein
LRLDGLTAEFDRVGVATVVTTIKWKIKLLLAHSNKCNLRVEHFYQVIKNRRMERDGVW